jgi:hypothetical protein
MCTLTYIPKGNGNFLLTSNRDESKHRQPAVFPVYQTIIGNQVLFPQDGDAKGTWLAVSENRVVSLLNGAFKRHKHQPPYRKSRGIVLLECFEYSSFEQFTFDYDFSGIEPFTIICLDQLHDELEMIEFRWDGLLTHFKILQPDQPHIYSSAPLYPKAVRLQREESFAEYLNNSPDVNRQQMVDFHRFGGDQEHPTIRLDESNFVRTVSISSIERNNGNLSMHYHDLKQDATIVETFK